jgi:glycosyltransferase involved in cell wall biosynthesis
LSKNMNREIIYVSDFFIEHIIGGCELNDDELIKLLKERDFEVRKVQSHLVKPEFLYDNKDCFFIISNFCNLSFECREWITKNCNYIIYEHDHKYLNTRNPANYRYFKAPQKEIRNFFFYKSADAVVAQSSFHKKIIEKNLSLKNVFSISGNLWSLSSLKKLRDNCKKHKNTRCSVLNSNIPHKNTSGATMYCEENNLGYELVSSNNYIDFLDKLGANKTFVFLPKTPETLSRVVVEARMMGMSVKTNSLVGACQEPWFELKGEELVDYMTAKRQEIGNFIEKTVKRAKRRAFSPKKVSIISTFHEGEAHLEGFLDDTTKQIEFDKYELIFVDAGSSGKEASIIKKYMDKYDNISYMRLENRLKPTPCLNMAVKKASGEYLTFGFIDDRRKSNCLAILLNEIENNDNIDLVYGDVLQTDKINETFDKNSSNGELFEHSRYNFSKENMVKCVPGPMPLWRKTMHEKVGFFDQEGCNFADDWEMWLRAVDDGAVFKKINEIVGLYFSGGRSRQSNNKEQLREEANLFFKYAHLFGTNFTKFRPYFSQILKGA